MAYIGNRPEQGNFRKCDAITTSATATYNLLVGGVAVNPNQNQCIVSLNGVIQSSGNSYTIASSQITFASALTSSDVIDFILILGDTLDVGTVSDDTIGLAQLSATGSPSSSNFLRGDNSWASAGGNNTPSFRVILSGNQSIANSTATKITFDTETWDSDSDFASNKFTVSEAGKYLIVLGGRISGFTDAEEFQLYFKKNGSDLNFGQSKIVSAGTNPLFLAQQSTIIEDLSASDYIEGWTYQNTGSAANIVATHTYMAGFKLIGV